MTRGLPIPGSRFIRDFCSICGEPMRVAKIMKSATCSACSHRRRGRSGGHRQTDDKAWFDNVVKAFENMEEFDDQGAE